MISTQTNFEPLNDADTFETDAPTHPRIVPRVTPRAAIVTRTGPPAPTSSIYTASRTQPSIVQARIGPQPPKKPVHANTTTTTTSDSEKPARVSRFKSERAAAGINFFPSRTFLIRRLQLLH